MASEFELGQRFKVGRIWALAATEENPNPPAAGFWLSIDGGQQHQLTFEEADYLVTRIQEESTLQEGIEVAKRLGPRTGPGAAQNGDADERT